MNEKTPPASIHRALTTDDYLRAANIVANCRNERLPYVLGFLEQGGFQIPKVQDMAEELSILLVTVLNEAINTHGLSVREIGRMTKLDPGTISSYRLGKHSPRPERAEYIIQVIQDAIGQQDATE